MKGGLLTRYRALLEEDMLKPDAGQAQVAAALDTLYRALKTERTGGGLLGRLFGPARSKAAPAPKGLYIYGDVGRGKSLLMDLFFASATTAAKQRVHFNAFMAETHQRIHEWRSLSSRERSQRPEFVKEAGDDPIAPVARHIANESRLLCFDEFQVNDVADAMILGRLFEKLFAAGVVIVLTSNTAPEDLYAGGLNRQLFLPFIALIESHMTVLELAGAQDYRLDRMTGVPVYTSPLGPAADAAMDRAWAQLTGGASGQPAVFDVLGRRFEVPLSVAGVARLSFEALCGTARGGADYLALAHHFHTVLIDRIPHLGVEHANEARRFTLLIDTLYDEKTALVCSAAAAPEALFAGAGENPWFKRTVSRLMEMQSADYLRQSLGAQAAQ